MEIYGGPCWWGRIWSRFEPNVGCPFEWWRTGFCGKEASYCYLIPVTLADTEEAAIKLADDSWPTGSRNEGVKWCEDAQTSDRFPRYDPKEVEADRAAEVQNFFDHPAGVKLAAVLVAVCQDREKMALSWSGELLEALKTTSWDGIHEFVPANNLYPAVRLPRGFWVWVGGVYRDDEGDLSYCRGAWRRSTRDEIKMFRCGKRVFPGDVTLDTFGTVEVRKAEISG